MQTFKQYFAENRDNPHIMKVLKKHGWAANHTGNISHPNHPKHTIYVDHVDTDWSHYNETNPENPARQGIGNIHNLDQHLTDFHKKHG